jgi:hypothetical protein
MMITFTLLTVVLYALFVRPTVLAKQFASAINRADGDELENVTLNGISLQTRMSRVAKQLTYAPTNVKAVAGLERQTWRDVWKFRRIVNVEIAAREDASLDKFRWSSLAKVIVTPASAEMAVGFSPPRLRGPE